MVDDGPDDVEPLAAAVERELAPPYRAEAIRRDGISGRSPPGRSRSSSCRASPASELELTVRAATSARLIVDGVPAFGSIPALERPEHVVTRAYRLDGEIWEVDCRPL